MGLRYSIFGFSQERVMNVRATSGDKELRLDVTDLLLLSQVADFPNRSNIIKVLEGEKMFFWMAYSEFLEELPILNLKKQALRDRFDKLVTLGLLEKMVNKANNMTLFRLTDMYEKLKYGSMIYDTEKGCVVNYEGVYSDTQGVCSGLHTISEYNNNKIYKEKDKEKESCDVAPMLFSAEQATAITYKTTTTNDKDFEDLWLLYERKGSKAAAKKEFAKLTEEEIATIRQHIPAYLESRPERQYRQDFERYIKHKTFNSVVYSKSNVVLFDPEATNTSTTCEAPQEFSQGTETITINGITYK
jgi:hypothetical protein